jgi:hypothetical protein
MIPMGIFVILCLFAGFIGWWIGAEQGYKLGSTYTDKHWRDARMWESRYFKLLMSGPPQQDEPDDRDDQPDDGGDDDDSEEETPQPEPVMAIAKAAGVGR